MNIIQAISDIDGKLNLLIDASRNGIKGEKTGMSVNVLEQEYERAKVLVKQAIDVIGQLKTEVAGHLNIINSLKTEIETHKSTISQQSQQILDHANTISTFTAVASHFHDAFTSLEEKLGLVHEAANVVANTIATPVTTPSVVEEAKTVVENVATEVAQVPAETEHLLANLDSLYAAKTVGAENVVANAASNVQATADALKAQIAAEAAHAIETPTTPAPVVETAPAAPVETTTPAAEKVTIAPL